jgi:hypothetical protein
VKEYTNVWTVPSKPVQWGRYSQLAAQFICLRSCLEANISWSHFINLTGQDFPLLSPDALLAELQTKTDQSFISYFDPLAERYWNDVEDRLSRIHFDSVLLEKVLRIPGIGRRIRSILGWTNRAPFVPFIRRARPRGFTYYGGANHFILARSAANYLVHDARAGTIIRRLRRTGFPEESSVQSALVNSCLRSDIVNDDRRAILWKNSSDPSPQTLTPADLPWLHEARARGKLFARKFDLASGSEMLDLMEREFLAS